MWEENVLLGCDSGNFYEKNIIFSYIQNLY